MEVVKYQEIGNIGEIVIDNPPVNATSHAVREGLMAALEKANLNARIQAIILRCEGRTFVAGADIREFGKPPKDPHLSVVNHAFESSPKPVVCALHGTALGGGLELALSCHVRLAAAGTRLGLPEVSLGILPGAGGTQRLPRLIGTAAAAEMIATGELIDARRALDLGVIDAIVEEDLRAAALVRARQMAQDNIPIRRTRELAADAISGEDLKRIEETIRRKARGQLAPFKALESVLAASRLPFDEGQEQERAFFRELVASEQAAALRHAFFVEREAVKPHSPDPSIKPGAIQTVGVVGSGTMGTGIAIAFLRADMSVVLTDAQDASLNRAKETIASALASDVAKGRSSEARMQQRQAALTLDTSLASLRSADLIIEAVYEDMAVKQEVFHQLDRVAKDGAILASNTSYLDVNRIAEAVRRPLPVLGLHFFSPAHVMRLVEVIRTDTVSDEAVLTVQAAIKRLGKTPVTMRVCDGFVGNRMLTQRTRQAYFMLEEGALPDRIDKVLHGFGFPMGPFQMADLAGLDVGWRNRQSRLDTLTPRERRCDILDQLYQQGRYGQKTGSGFYRYDNGRDPQPDPQVEALIVAHSERVGLRRREVSDEEILVRCVHPMINEGARLLEEGIVQRPGDIDTVWLHGYGFPRYRGGPMFYADGIGLEKVLETMRRYHAETGEAYWKPAGLLADLARSGKGFYTAD